MSALDAIRDEIAGAKDQLASIAARVSQIAAEIADLAEEGDALSKSVPILERWLATRERALALLTEQEAPEPIEADPGPVEAPVATPKLPAPTPERARIRSEMDEMTRSRHEAEATDRLPAGEAPDHRAVATKPPPRRAHRSGDVAVRAPRGGGGNAAKPNGCHRILDGGAYETEIPRMLASPMWMQRCELVIELLQDRRGHASGYELTLDVIAMLECKQTTAQTIVSRCIAVLYHQGRVADTGQKDEGSDGKLRSDVWKIKETQS